MFIEAHQQVFSVKQFPGTGAVAETIDFIPRHMTPPGPHLLTRRTLPRVPGQDRKPHVLHLFQMKDAFQPHRRQTLVRKPRWSEPYSSLKHSSAVFEPGRHVGPQQEGPCVLRLAKKKLSGTAGVSPSCEGGSGNAITEPSSSFRDAAWWASAQRTTCPGHLLQILHSAASLRSAATEIVDLPENLWLDSGAVWWIGG